jgi:SAM-dependent methyltransferase
MQYDPIKNSLAAVIRKLPFLRVLFYKLLDILFLRSWYVRRVLRDIRKRFEKKSISILDAGTGYGQYSYFMAKKLQPNNIVAVDVKEKWIEDCAGFFNSLHLNNVKFKVEDLTEINYSNQFDLITCIDVMEHIEKDTRVFSNFYNALKKGGYLIINSPSIFGGSDVHDEGEESFIGEHFRDGYSSADLTEKLAPLGFEVVESRYTYGKWGDLAWRLGIKFPMQILNKSKFFFLIIPFYYLLTFWLTLILMYMDYKSDNEIGSGINFIAKK